MRQVTDSDAALLALDRPVRPGHIGVLGIYGPDLTPAVLTEALGQRLHLAPSTRRTLVRPPLGLDRPWWIEDPTFELSRHVDRVTVPAPGGWPELSAAVARTHGRGLDLERPLWRAVLLEGLGELPGFPSGSVGLLLILHTATLDPLSGADLVSALHDRSPDVDPFPPRRRWTPDPQPPASALLTRAVLNAVRRPVTTAFRLPSVQAGTGLVTDRLAGLGRSRAPRSRFNVDLSGEVTFGASSIRMADLRTIRAAVAHATANDVLLSLVAGTMRRYMIGRGEDPVELRVLCPFAARQSSDSVSPDELVSVTTVRLRSDLADPLRRLAATAENTRVAQLVQIPARARYLSQLAEVEPGRWFGVAARQLCRFAVGTNTRSAANTVLHNAPGPSVPLYLAGVPLLGSYTVGPQLEGIGLTHGVASYLDQITVSVTADRAALPDPDRYVACFDDTVAEALAAA